MLRTPDGFYTSKDGETYIQVCERSSGEEIPVNGDITEFSNEFFEGRLLFMHRPNTIDPSAMKDFQYASVFNGKRRLWELHIQGKFKPAFFSPGCTYDAKVQPSGGPASVYIGVESEALAKMGLVSMSVARIMTGMLRAFNSTSPFRMSLSYGNTDGSDLPHISYPLPYIPNKLIWTPANMTPPAIGSKALQEMDGMKKDDCVIKPDLVYTMVMYSMYVDLIEWHVASLPGLRDVPLSKILGDHGVRVTMYDDFKDPKIRDKNPHDPKRRRTFFDISVERIRIKEVLSPTAGPLLLHRGMLRNTRGSDPISPSTRSRPDTPYSRFSHADLISDKAVASPGQELDGDDLRPLPEETSETDTETSEAGSDELQEQEFQSAHSDMSDASQGSAASDAFRMEIAGVDPKHASVAWLWGQRPNIVRLMSTNTVSSPWYIVALTSTEKNRVRLGIWFLLEVRHGEDSSWAVRSLSDVLELIQSAGDGSMAPYMKRSRLRRTLPRMIHAPMKNGKAAGSLPARPVAYVQQKLADTLTTINNKSSSVSLQREMLSNFLGIRIEGPDGLAAIHTTALLTPPNFFELTANGRKTFARAMKEQSDVGGVVGSIVFEGRIAEEYLAVQCASGTLKLWAPFVNRPRINISVDTITGVKALTETDGKFGLFCLFVIDTTLKSFHFLAINSKTRDEWVQKIIDAIPRLRRSSLHPQVMGTPRSLLVHPLVLDPSFCRRWVPANRLVLNDRRIIFRSERIANPVKFSEVLLNAALEFGGSSPQCSAADGDGLVIRNILDFFHAVDDLKNVSFDTMTAAQKLAFWLNIYHTLMLHGFMQIGRPNSTKQVAVFQNRVSYLVESQPFSLTEIEFLILRKYSSTPLQRIRSLWSSSPPTFWRREKEQLPSKECNALHLPRLLESEVSIQKARFATSDVDNQMTTDITDACDLQLEMDGSDEERKSEKSRKSAVSTQEISFWTRYAPGFPEPRINFVLNSGTLSCLDSIMVFNEMELESQLNIASEHFLLAFCHIEGPQRFSPLVRIRAIVMRLALRKPAPIAARATFPYCMRRFRQDIRYAPMNTWLEYISQFLSAEKRAIIQSLPANANISTRYHKYRCSVHPSFAKMRVTSI